MAQSRLSPPGLAQFVASGASDLPADYAAGVVAEYQKRRDVLYRGLKSLPGVFLAKPEGAFYFVARLPIESGDDFASWMLSDFSLDGATVMVAPAAGFYATAGLGADEVRIAYVLNATDLEASVKILASGLKEYAAARTGARQSLTTRRGGHGRAGLHTNRELIAPGAYTNLFFWRKLDHLRQKPAGRRTFLANLFQFPVSRPVSVFGTFAGAAPRLPGLQDRDRFGIETHRRPDLR
jgi:hypothetical protein